MATRTRYRLILSCIAAAAITSAVLLTRPPEAEACGCFTPPDPSVPIVQAGERIVFGMENGNVVAHIQVQYSGSADEFGWLLPLPELPEISVGTDELFTRIIATTQPLYRLDREYFGDCWFDPNRSNSGGGFGDSSSAPEDGEPPPNDPHSPLVIQDSVGPFDYAVLRADSKDEMLAWLDANSYFVPAGTDDVVDPYIRPGAYFVAVKLQKGNDVGDIQPIVVKYRSDLPMIPIVLTSVAADPDMPVQVWVLGKHRAIPRNYFHTKINDAKLNWFDGAQNYVDVITDAVDEADGHHSFVTEYAGTDDVMLNQLDYAGRFGDLTQLASITGAQQYIEFLNANGYQVSSSANQPFFSAQYGAQMLAILSRHLPIPPKLAAENVTPNQYYTNISYYLGSDRQFRPQIYSDADLSFDPVALTQELSERIVDPTLNAGKLFKTHSYMTRLFTTLSPEEMTKDPVFSFNPDLPEVSNTHSGRLTYFCGLISDDDPTTTPAVLVTEDGWKLEYPNGIGDGTADRNAWLDVEMPQSRFTQVVREEGDADNVKDNTKAILAAINAQNGDGGCSTSGGTSGLAGTLLALGAVALGARRRQRSRGARG